MVRYLIILLLVLVSPGVVVAADEGPLEPDTLLNWLRIIDLPDMRLVYAGDVGGYYFAVKVDKDGDLLFCEHNHGDHNRKGHRQYSIDVLDSKGKSLHDAGSKKKWPDSVEITYRRKAAVGPLWASSESTVAYPRGSLFTLKKHDEPAVTVEYVETTGGKRRVILSQRIPLSRKPALSNNNGF